MTKTTTLPITQNIKSPNAQITNASGTSAVQLAYNGSNYSVGADDAVVKSLMAVSTDSAAKNVQVIVNDGTNDRVIGTVPIPALAGSDGTVVAVDLLNSVYMPGLPIDQNGKRVLPLKGAAVLKVKAVATLTAAKTIDVTSVIEEF